MVLLATRLIKKCMTDVASILLKLSRCKLVSVVNDVLNNIMSRVFSSIAAMFIYWLIMNVILSIGSVCHWSLALVRAELHWGLSAIA